MAEATRSMSTPVGLTGTKETSRALASSASTCTSSQPGIIVVRNPRLLLSRPVAARVSSVDCPLTCNTRANARTRSDRSLREHALTAPMPMPSDCACDKGLYHLARVDDTIKLFLGDEAQLQGCSLQREVV